MAVHAGGARWKPSAAPLDLPGSRSKGRVVADRWRRPVAPCTGMSEARAAKPGGILGMGARTSRLKRLHDFRTARSRRTEAGPERQSRANLVSVAVSTPAGSQHG